MFIALEIALQLARKVRPIVEAIRRHDKDLAEQLQTAQSSVALNLAEGSKRAGRDQLHHYRVASGSGNEARTALALGEAWGSLDGIALDEVEALFDRQAAVVHRLTHPRR